ncbi:zinc finger BED domain-containing protein RICESLEEPER 2-like protein [Tanacetum coccineum]
MVQGLSTYGACIKSAYAKPEVMRIGIEPPITKVVEGVETSIAPTTAEEKAQRRLKVCHQSGNHTYHCVAKNKPVEIDTLSLDDSLTTPPQKIYEPEVKGTSSSSTNTQNVAFVSSNSTSSTNGAINTAHGAIAASTQGRVGWGCLGGGLAQGGELFTKQEWLTSGLLTSELLTSGSTSSPIIREIIATNRNPNIWKDFNLCIMTDNSQKAQCKHCFHFLSVGSNTTLKNHISHPHCEAKKAQQNQNPEAGQTSMARDGSVFRYDPDYLREQFAGLVIQRALPFNHFDHEQTTRVFQNTMQPRYTHVSRSTLKRDAMKLWLVAKQEIIASFGNINACVNLTTDVWSAPHGVPGSYMCVTAHWIEPGTWQMMKRVISFEEFPSPHTGGALFKMLTKVLTNFNLEDKVMSITLDNASNNTSAMDKLKLKYDPPMGGRFYHSRCVAHIINLVVQAGLEVPAIDAIRESFKTMLKDIFKSSARTRQRYVKICKDAEKPCLRPNWDVPTRWNSTYHMFLSGLKQQNTLAYFHDLLANKNRIDADQLLAKILQERQQEELTIEERAKLFQQLLKKRRKHFAAKRAEEMRNIPPTRA